VTLAGDDVVGPPLIGPAVGDRIAVVGRNFIGGRVPGTVVSVDGLRCRVRYDHLPNALADIDWTRIDVEVTRG